ncbi:MAG: Xaa-Pro peptidase family protein [Planctomycetota bacterium]|nr:Xaa-Pro peptidase family protein [Planctomycetota bacterium]
MPAPVPIYALALAALATSAAHAHTPAADSGPTSSGESPVAGQEHVRRCGLGAKFHAGRRAALVAELRKETPNGLVLVRGLPSQRDYERFQQDKTFWYLTGVESPNAVLLMDLASGDEILFLPKPNAMKERWEGEQWDSEDEWIRATTGFREVRPGSELVGLLKERAAAAKVVWISKEPWITLAGCYDLAVPYDRAIERDPLDGRTSRENALQDKLEDTFAFEVRDCAPVLAEMRRVKTPEELAALRRASETGARAMSEAIRSTRAGLTERHLEAVMSFVHRAEGAAGPGYHGIVGCGPNALILHYSQVGRDLRAGEMLLLDYAPEFDHYVSDITRSWPVDGVFTPRMAEIYDAVLASQLAGIAEVRPGRTMADVEKACRRVLSERGMLKLLPHGTCHYVGMEVHDVGENAKPLVPGVVFTVEPGLYDPASGIGVRIEDVVVVTETGCEVISAGVTKDRAELTRLIAEEGILDRWTSGEAPALETVSTTTTPR